MALSADKAQTVTLRDVARQANVSVGTVSRALAGEPGVGQKRAKSIQSLAQKLGYRPQPLRRKKTNAVGVFVATDQPGRPDEDWSQRLIVLATQQAVTMGLHVHLEFVSRHDEVNMPAVVRENRVDGVLLAAHPHDSLLKKLKRIKIPMAMIGGNAQQASCVCINPNRDQALNLAIDRLVVLGHRDFGLVLSDREYPSTERFYQVCLDRLISHGIELTPHRVLEVKQADLAGGQLAVANWLATGQPLPTAVLLGNDWMAMGTMLALASAGYRMPQDVSLVGQDNRDWCAQTQPALTSIDNHDQQLVQQGLDWLVKQIDGQVVEPDDVFVEGELIWRDSCSAVREG
jgi:LacI family transcriptional regulator